MGSWGGNQKFPLVIGQNSIGWDEVLIKNPRGPVVMANLVSNVSEYTHSDDFHEKICTGLWELYVPARN